MTTGPGRYDPFEEQHRRQEAREARRKHQRNQRILLGVALVVALALLVFCVVMIVRAVAEPKVPAPVVPSAAGSPSAASLSGSQPPSRPQAADPAAWNLILINNNNPMPDGYEAKLEEEQKLVAVDSVGHLFYAGEAADQLTAMVETCNTQTEGGSLSIISAFRGPQTQNGKYEALVAAYKAEGKSDAEADKLARQTDPPFGYSDHQTALAVDFVTGGAGEATDDFANTAEAGWLRVHAAEYGFILRFPENKVEITGIQYQPYHFRYVGVEDAKAISAAGISLEEYLAQED